jgi:cleavage stimulation factor subunit 2
MLLFPWQSILLLISLCLQAPSSFQARPLPSAMPSNGYSLHPQPPTNSSIPPLPPGIDLPPGLTCPDAISRTLNTLPPAQLLDVLSQMKTLATTDAAKATELLHQAPQLSYAIFQALLLMGLVSTEALSSVVEAASAAPPVPTPQQTYSVPPQGNYPAGFPPPPQHMSGQLGMPIGTPPVQGQNLYPPPPPQRAPPPQQQVPQDTDAMIQQLLDMPQSLVDQLPPAERAQVIQLRAQYGR